MPVHHAAEHEGGVGHRPVYQVTNGVGRVVAIAPGTDQGRTVLVDQQHGAQLLRGPPERGKLRFIVGPAIDMVADHGSLESQLGH